MSRLLDTYWRYLHQMDMQSWFVVLIAVLVMGVCCMRGFGSRSEY